MDNKPAIPTNNSRNNLIYGLVIFTWLVYVFLTFTTPQNPSANVYNLTPFTIMLLRISFVLPYLFIWLTAVYGVLRLETYIRTISGSKEAKALSHIVTGLFFLIDSMVLTTILGAIRSYLGPDFDLRVLFTIINNYIYVLTPLISFAFIMWGSKELLKTLKQTAVDKVNLYLSFIPLALFCLLYVWLVFTNTTRQVSSNALQSPSYYLPDFLIVTTIIVPASIGWFLGVKAVVNIKQYAKDVPGIIYKKSLSLVATGIVWTISGSILLQFVLSLGSDRLVGVGLAGILVIVYVFLLVQVIGYVLIAKGSHKLTKIEVV